ncbi:hypothetical protein [Streptomyces sp. NBC_00019]|uniref:hypothetical protein n=1 Tax=Streptomyces sp. NBC_00019 TaxID=2975623 RepID=UPI00324B5EDF
MRKNRVITLLAASALLTGGSLTFGASSAAAAPDFTFEKCGVVSNGGFCIAVYTNGTYSGIAIWQADPLGEDPGDSMRAADYYGDGWGVNAILESPYRLASTDGHAAPYKTGWKSGDLTEGTSVRMRICMHQDLNSVCSPYYSGHA